MSKIKALARRHGTSLMAVAIGALVIPWGLRALFMLPEVEANSNGFGALVLLRLLTFLSSAMPSAGGLSGDEVVGLFITAIGGWGLFLGAWRLTRNRAVATAAGILYSVHPVFLTAFQSQGFDDRLGAALAAWALAFQFGAAPTSGRFPNRGPSRFRPRAFAVFLLALFLTSQAYLFGPLLIVADLVLLDRDQKFRWRQHHWRSYLPYVGLSALSILFGLIGPQSRAWTEVGPGQIVVAALFARNGVASSTLTWLLAIALVLLGLLAVALDLAIGAGQRRVVLRYGVFAAGWQAISVLVIPLAGSSAALQAAPLAALGLALLVPLLLWRVAVSAWPEGPPASTLGDIAPSIDVWNARLGLAPVPTLNFVELPDLSFAEDSVANGDRSGRPRRVPEDLIEALIRSRYAGSGLAVEIAAANGSFRESTRIAVAREQTRVLLPGAVVSSEARERLRGLTGVRIEALAQHAALPFGVSEVHAVFLSDGFSILARPALETMKEIARVLVPGGLVAGVVDEAEVEAGRAPSPELLRSILVGVGLEVEAVETAPGMGFVFTAKRATS
ncbi:MAG: class I SAM-dependent methyltransferase [Planctomycetota bacterium]